jgi:hypothetical protein
MSTSVNISKRIKITIPNDPIFSGTYVFDKDFGDIYLQSSNWILNTGLSQHNLSLYDHPESIMNGKLLVSLNDTGFDGSLPGYNELKTSLYKQENNFQSSQLEDAFSFPAKFIFTAVQPPCPCSGDIGTAWPPVSTQGTGHRLAVGFATPIRWRHPYDSWIVVDRINHTIPGTITNYATGVAFNNGMTYFSTTDQTNVALNNCKSIKYTESQVPGTLISEIGDGYISISYDNSYTGFWPVCTGLTDLGFAFRVSASGLGTDKGRHSWSNAIGMYEENTYIQGIGPTQYHETYYTWNEQDGAPTTLVDERPFFEPKIPVTAEIEFTYSCRNGLPCFELTPVQITDNSIATISDISISSCTYNPNPNIYLNYLCGGNQTTVPNDNIWINNSITGIRVIFSGISGTAPGVTTDSLSLANRSYDIYLSNQENPIIELPYGGGTNLNGATPTLVQDWITKNLILVDANNINLNQNNFNTNLINKNIGFFPSVDLYWNIDYINYIATVYMVPNESHFGFNYSIAVEGAGTVGVDGQYKFESGYYKNVANLDEWKIRLTSMGYIIGKGNSPEDWVSYYLLPSTESLVLNNPVSWSLPINFAGSSPAPTSIITANSQFVA